MIALRSDDGKVAGEVGGFWLRHCPGASFFQAFAPTVLQVASRTGADQPPSRRPCALPFSGTVRRAPTP